MNGERCPRRKLSARLGSNYRRLRSGVNPTRNIVIADRATLLGAFGYNSLDCLASILAANQKGQYAESNPLPLV
jgi:hypothetical protein